MASVSVRGMWLRLTKPTAAARIAAAARPLVRFNGTRSRAKAARQAINSVRRRPRRSAR